MPRAKVTKWLPLAPVAFFLAARAARNRLRCSLSMSRNRGKLALRLMVEGSAAWTPATRGWATRSSISGPRRRRTNDSRLSSSLPPLGRKRSPSTRSLPFHDRSDERNRGVRRDGAISSSPSGRSWRRPSHHTREPPTPGRVGRTSPSRPRWAASSRTVLFCATKLSGPASTTNPSTCSVRTLPPRRCEASTIATSTPAWRRWWAATSPVTPPPTTTTGPISDTCHGFGHDVAQGVDQGGMVVEAAAAVEFDPDLVGVLAVLDVVVVQSLDVVGDEPDRVDHHRRCAPCLQLVHHVLHRRPEPRLASGCRHALVGDVPVGEAEAGSHLAGGGGQLVDVGVALVDHALGQAVGSEHDRGSFGRLTERFGEHLGQAFHVAGCEVPVGRETQRLDPAL